MTIKIDPFSGLQYGEDKGADNWNIWMDSNLLQIGATLNIAVQSATTTAPASIVNGQRWIIPAGATGVWAAHVGKLAFAAEGSYTYLPAVAGMYAQVLDTETFLTYNGSAWIDPDDFGTL